MGDIDEMIAAVRALDAVPERAAKIAADKLDAAVKATASSGASPDGKAWAPTKKGGRAMAKAASHIETRALGPVVRMTLSGPDVFHHFGKGDSEARRQVIPDAGGPMPRVVSDVLEQATSEAIAEIMKGSGR